jgi:hypothetical protein
MRWSEAEIRVQMHLFGKRCTKNWCAKTVLTIPSRAFFFLKKARLGQQAKQRAFFFFAYLRRTGHWSDVTYFPTLF